MRTGLTVTFDSQGLPHFTFVYSTIPFTHLGWLGLTCISVQLISQCHPSKRQCACFHQRQNGSQQLPCQNWWNIPYLSGLWDLAIKLPIAGVVCSQMWLFLIPFYDLVHKYIMLTYLTQWNLKHSTWCPFSNRMNTDFGNILRHFQGHEKWPLWRLREFASPMSNSTEFLYPWSTKNCNQTVQNDDSANKTPMQPLVELQPRRSRL